MIFLEVIENLYKCTSYEVKLETTLDHDDDNASSESEVEIIDSSENEIEDGES
jgi:hypothetical protein